MNKIGLIDSGLGTYNAISTDVLQKYQLVRLPQKKFFSYGNLPDKELLRILAYHLQYLSTFNLEHIFVGCYTLSCIIEKYNIEVPGLISMLDLAYEYIFNGAVGTPTTCQYLTSRGHKCISQPTLAANIQSNLPPELVKGSLKDRQVLVACTHYYNVIAEIEEFYEPNQLLTPTLQLRHL